VFCLGQAETGVVTGTVVDPTGAVVQGATVTATNLATQAKRTAISNAEGLYSLAALPPGQYQVDVTAATFAPYKETLTVTVGSRNVMSPRLQLTTTATTVEVTAGGGAVQVETQTSDISTVVSSQQVAALPTLTRNPYDFVSTAGNVAEDQGSGLAGRGANGISINGQRAASTSILLDGAENVDLFTASVGQQVPLDSVQEFRVTTSDWGAEYGRASGGVINVATKSGGNDFHGTAYEYNRLSALATNTYDNNANGTPKPGFTRNQFGYSVGGPVLKNKLFFFNSTEWTRVRSSATQLAYVPDPAFLALTSANTQSYFNAYGKLKSNLAYKSSLTAGYLTSQGIATGAAFGAIPSGTKVLNLVSFPFNSDVGGGAPQNAINSVVRVDYNINDKNSMFGRYAVYNNDLFPGYVSANAYQGFDTGESDLNQNIALSFTHIFSPKLLSTTKVNYNRLNDLQPLGSLGAIPNMYFTTGGQATINGQTTMLPGYLPLSTANSIPFGGPQNVTQFSEAISLIHGVHEFKFGGEYIYTQDNRVFGAYEEGGEFLAHNSVSSAFDAMVTGDNLYRFTAAINPQNKFPCFRDPLTNDLIQTTSCTIQGPAGSPNFSRSNRYNDASLYFQDNWKFNRRLNVTLGLRWEYYGVQHDMTPSNDANLVLGTGSNFFQKLSTAYVANGHNLPDGRLWNPNYHQFGPRVGFAYDLTGDGKTSLRGGYGISYERNFGNVTFNVIQNPPNYAVLNITNASDVPAGSIHITTDNLGPAAQPGSFAFPSPTLRAVDRNIKPAYAHMWNFSLQRQVAKDTVAALEYSGSRGVNQYSISNYNDNGYGATYLGVGCEPGQTQANCTNGLQRLNLQYNAINYRTNGGDTYHHAMNARVETHNLHNTGLDLTANYTWSHTIDDLSATFGGSDEYNGNTLGFLDPFNPGLDRGNADYDVRHRFVVSAIWAVPFAKETHGWMNQVLDGWEVSPIFTARTGFPLTVYDCTFANYNCPRYIPSAGIKSSGSTSTSASASQGPNVFTYLTLPTALTYLDPGKNESELPTCTSSGCNFPSNMTSRNYFTQPGYWNSTLGVFKNFRVTERVKMQFRAEFYNLFNHSNYYVQTGALNNVSGFGADAYATTLNPATASQVANINCVTTATCTIGGLEFTNAAGAGVPYTVIGKKGAQTINNFGSLGERRFIQFALRLTF
jgi:outer membrane receptor protein involved in Fe transport